MSTNDQKTNSQSATRKGGRAARAFTPLSRDAKVSFEFFPPSNDATASTFGKSLDRLCELSPRFVSVTYGAGGTTRERSFDAIHTVVERAAAPAAAHLTCVAATKADTDATIDRFAALGVERFVALRGDLPADNPAPLPGYRNALEMVEAIARRGDFDISVAAYPESHPDAPSQAAEIDYLKAKIDAGASRAITQFFFDTDAYLRFVDRARAAGISAPIVPGILPITNFHRAADFARRCGASVPAWFAETFDGLDNDPLTRQMVAVAVAAEQCRTLRTHGVNEFHFYTLNRSELTRSLCHLLGVRASTSKAPAAAMEPSAQIEPSAHIEPSAQIEPSAHIEPSARIEPSAPIEPSARKEKGIVR